VIGWLISCAIDAANWSIVAVRPAPHASLPLGNGFAAIAAFCP
jgi:hypothetical protein